MVEVDEFYYPWQGEDSIYCRAVNYDMENQVFIPAYLEVNGKLVGISNEYSKDIPDSGSILTIIYEPDVFVYDEIQPDLSFIERFPNLVGISMDLFFFLDVQYIDSIPSHIYILDSIPTRVRLYLECYDVSDGELTSLSKYSNIRTLWLWGWFCPRGVEQLFRIKELRVLSIPHHVAKQYPDGPFSSEPFDSFPKLREGGFSDALY